MSSKTLKILRHYVHLTSNWQQLARHTGNAFPSGIFYLWDSFWNEECVDYCEKRLRAKDLLYSLRLRGIEVIQDNGHNLIRLKNGTYLMQDWNGEAFVHPYVQQQQYREMLRSYKISARAFIRKLQSFDRMWPYADFTLEQVNFKIEQEEMIDRIEETTRTALRGKSR